MRKAYDTGSLLNAIAEELGPDTGDDFDVIKEDGTPVVDPEPIIDKPAEDKPVEEPKPAEQPAAEQRPWSDDYEDLKAKHDYLKGLVERQHVPAVPAAPTPEAPKPLREITDGDEYAARMESLERQANASYNAVKMLESQNAQRTLAELKKEFPDIDQFVPISDIQKGIDVRVQSGNIGGDWREPMLKVYDLVTGNKRFAVKDTRIQELEAELTRLKDEVAQKRADREAKDVRAAAQVPAGGSVYQDASSPTVTKVTPKLRGSSAYDAAGKAMEQALARHGG